MDERGTLIPDPDQPRERQGHPLPPATLVLVGVYQDGAEFYREEDDQLLASYSDLVMHDYDMEGATLARRRFIEQFPEHGYVQREGGA